MPTKKISLKKLVPGKVVKYCHPGNVDSPLVEILEGLSPFGGSPRYKVKFLNGPRAGSTLETARYFLKVEVGGKWVKGEKLDGSPYNGRLI